MKIQETPFKGLFILKPTVFSDVRGSFYESYNRRTFHKLGIHSEFVQDNESVSGKGVIRGLHFQVPPFEQGKIVRVLRGKAFDVAVDLRQNSDTFGKYFSMVLSEDSDDQIWIPPGFAHGFASLEDGTIFSYKVTNYYDHDSERGIRYDDPEINIPWNVTSPIISEKDLKLPGFREFITGSGW